MIIHRKLEIQKSTQEKQSHLKSHPLDLTMIKFNLCLHVGMSAWISFLKISWGHLRQATEHHNFSFKIMFYGSYSILI